MLDIVKVITRSNDDKFDNVVFFDRSSEAVTETQRRIRGAIGFTGDFTSVVLAGSPEPDVPEESDSLAPPTNAADTLATRDEQRRLNQRDAFVAQFPFDIVNLDLEEFAFKRNDPFPGKVVQAIRKVAMWQKRSRIISTNRGQRRMTIDGFTLMFTTQIGPPDMTDEYKAMLRGYLQENVERKPELLDRLGERVGANAIDALEREHFDEFFKIGIRKVLAKILLETDWFVDPDEGIKTFQFTRTFDGGEYTMLHFVMEVKRQEPSVNRRAPNTVAAVALNAYETIVDDLFAKPAVCVTEEVVGGAILKPTLDEIAARRLKYYPATDEAS